MTGAGLLVAATARVYRVSPLQKRGLTDNTFQDQSEPWIATEVTFGVDDPAQVWNTCPDSNHGAAKCLPCVRLSDVEPSYVCHSGARDPPSTPS